MFETCFRQDHFTFILIFKVFVMYEIN